jgi:hypothetical protein
VQVARITSEPVGLVVGSEVELHPRHHPTVSRRLDRSSLTEGTDVDVGGRGCGGVH